LTTLFEDLQTFTIFIEEFSKTLPHYLKI